MTLNLDYTQKVRFAFIVDMEVSTYDKIVVTAEINGKETEKELTFAAVPPLKWCPKKHRMYLLNCMVAFDPQQGSIFVSGLFDPKKATAPILYQVLKDGKIKELKYSKDIEPSQYATEIRNPTVSPAVIDDISKKYFDMVNEKYFEFSSQNDIIAVVEQVANTDLVVTTFEPLHSAEKTVVGVDYSKDAADATAYAMHNVEVPKKHPPKDDYQELLDNIEHTIDVVSNDKLPYHERAKANRVLSVYFDRLNKYVHDTHVENIKAENKADKEYYKLYYAFLGDPKNVADNGKKPSDASAKAYATNATLDLYLDAKLSEALLKYLQSRLRSLNSIFEGVRQEVSNDKKIEEQSKIQK